MDLPGYQMGEAVAAGPRHGLLRARRAGDGLAVLVETVPADQEAAVLCLRRELEVSRFLDGGERGGVVRALDFMQIDGTAALVREDPGGWPLDHLLNGGGDGDSNFPLGSPQRDSGPLDLRTVLAVAARLADALAVLHQRGFIHRDLQPCHVLVDPAKRTAGLMGLGFASRAPREWQGFDPANLRSAALAYISPEQTGRTHRLMDYRTDLYSLGVTLFEMLTGELPFAAADPLELIHAHIARRPPAPSEVAAGVPEAVSEIVLKLLAKTAEERYQGGHGLSHDLERCLHELDAGGEIRTFDLGDRDVPARFELPQRLYGREKELERLERLLTAAGRGEARVLMVSGFAGVGKTSLLRELRRHVLLRGGIFTSGKYDELERGTPYSAVLAALRGLVRNLLLEEPERVASLRRRLTEALGPNLGVVVEVLPELETVVGAPPPVEALEPVRATNRFHLSLGRLLGVFAAADPPRHSGPLVIFLDDLQWIDASSLELLKSLLDPGNGSFLMLGAYRESSVDEHHPLTVALSELRGRGIEVETLRLAPLGPDDVKELVAHTLRADSERIAALAEAVYRKTAGNAFFVKAFLASLYEEGYLTFDPASGWSWELGRIAAMEATENVVELVARKIARLPAETRRATALAALLGNRFEVSTLASVCGLTVDETEAHLIAACRERILVKQERDYQFEHDGLRESAYAFIPDATRAETHLHIGRSLIRRQDTEASDFEVAKHLNRAAALLVSAEEREEAARLNLRAGRRARQAAAFPAAFQYFSHGLAFLEGGGVSPPRSPQGDGAWHERYELSLALYNEAAEAAVHTADFDEADRLVGVVMQRGRTLLDKVPAYEARIAAANARLREEEALATCREILALLGVEVPATPSPDEIREAFWTAHRRIEPMLARDVEELSVLTDPARLAAGRILIRMASIAGRADPTLGRLAACKLLDLAVEHGHSAPAAFGYILLGDIRCNVLGDLEGGYRAGVFGLALLDRFEDRWMRHVGHAFFNVLIRTWKTPLAALAESFVEFNSRAVEDGDYQVAGGNAYQLCICELLSGRELGAVEATIRHYLADLTRLGQQMYTLTLHRLLQVTLELMDRRDEMPAPGARTPRRGLGADSNVEVRVAGPEMMLRHVLRQRRPAVRLALESEDLPEHALPGIPFDFYRCLIFLDRPSGEEHAGDPPGLDRVAAYREKLAARARVAPESYQHKLDLVDAELERVRGRPGEAVALYERALAGAREHGFVHEEALIGELAAELFFDLGAERLAGFYLRAAISAYESWGARRKVGELRERHPEHLAPTSRPPAFDASPAPAVAETDALDMLSLERAASALAGELDLSELLEKLMAVLLQNTGAQRGYLLRYCDGRIEVEAGGSVDEDEPAVLAPHTLPLEECDRIAQSLVRYVSRSLERVVLADAGVDERFANDPYIVREQPKSILCAPILHQGQPVAILYLENNRTPDTFVDDRQAAVHLISSQAAVALENARLHHELKQEVAMRLGVEEDLRRALAETERLKDRLEAENVYLREEIRGTHGLTEIVGESAGLKQVLRRVEQVAATDATVLVLGETGTGKELVARAVHSQSPRAGRPLVKVNCATLPGTLIESELFGHERGAFTGAHIRKVGRFELADGGTIFLDEIGDLPPELQVKLLRILQEGEFERLGSTKTRRVDVRIIAATNRDLERLIAEGTFRADLYYRLTVFPLELPPLRERRDDVSLLVWHFIRKKEARLGKSIRDVPRDVMRLLESHTWPGNVRELENVIERALILSSGTALKLDGSFAAQVPRPGTVGSEYLDDVEREHFVRVLEACGWKVKGKGNAAQRLGLHPSTLRFRMKKLGIERP